MELRTNLGLKGDITNARSSPSVAHALLYCLLLTWERGYEMKSFLLIENLQCTEKQCYAFSHAIEKSLLYDIVIVI